MRIQLNKLARLNDEGEEKFTSLNYQKAVKKQFEDLKNQYNIPNKYTQALSYRREEYIICYICPHCGVEIYGEWIYPFLVNYLIGSKNQYHISSENQFPNAYNNTVFSQYDNDTINAFIDNCNVNYITALAEEAVYVGTLKKCPICNNDLTPEKPYAIQSLHGIPFYKKLKSFENELNFNDAGTRISPEKTISYGRVENSHISRDSFLYSPNEGFEKLKPNIDEKIKEQASCKLNNYIDSINSFISPKHLISVNLKEYISNLINLETNILSLTQRLQELYYFKIINNINVTFEENFQLYDLRLAIESQKKKLTKAKTTLTKFKNKPIEFKVHNYPPKPEYPKLLKAYFYNKRKVEKKNQELLNDYQQKILLYEEEVKRCDILNDKNERSAITRKNNRIVEYDIIVNTHSEELNNLTNELDNKQKNKCYLPTKAHGEKSLLDFEIQNAEESIKKLYNCRNELYSYNIVFEKYRNIVALSTFYEYLMSGRCETLDGVNGAYNIYENELRLNTIITKLDEIKENQFIIYNKLRDISKSLNNLNVSMQKAVSSLDTISMNTSDMNVYLDNISKNTAVIAHNSAVTAYYSKVNAELTNALGFMIALK